MSSDLLRGQARDYYEGKLRTHGATPAGVDWNSQESQELRFALLDDSLKLRFSEVLVSNLL